MQNQKYTYIFLFSSLATLSFFHFNSGFLNNYYISQIMIVIMLPVFFMIKNDLKNFYEKNILIAVLLLFLSFFISTVFSDIGNSDPWYRLISIFTCIFFSWIVSFLYFKRKFSLDFLLFILAFFGVVHVGVVLVYSLYLEDPFNHRWSYTLPLFNNIRNISDFLAICYICSTVLFFKFNDKRKPIFFIFCIVILAFLMWSGSRSSLVSLFIPLFLIIMFFNKKVINIIYIIIFFVSSYLISCLFVVSDPMLGFLKSFVRSVNDGDINSVSSGRMEIYSTIFDLSLQKPWFGYGGEVVRNYIRDLVGSPIGQAHNFIFQIIIEYGYLGLCLFIFLLMELFKIDINKINSHNFVIIAVVICILVSSLFNGGFYYISTLCLFCVFLGMMRVEYGKEK